MDKEEMIKEEAAEHPKLSKKQINQIVTDHLKKHISEMNETEEDEAEEEAQFDPEAKKNRFEKMKKVLNGVKDDKVAEKAGEYD